MNYSTANMRMWSRLGPSGSLGVAAIEIVKEHDNILFLSADMTFAAGLERLRNMFPDRIYNVGIAEQNLVGISSGLASEGFSPFAVTYATFFATRALDQVKMNLGYMKQPVKMVGLNAGFAAGILGATHMAIEDIAAMRSIPNMVIISPADMTEVVKAIEAVAVIDKPVYIRLTGEMNQQQVYTDDYDFEIGKSVVLKEGKDATIFSCGTVTSNCLRAANALEEIGISCKVVNMHTVKPLDIDTIDKCADSKFFVTVEEHSINGGLGGAVSEYLSEKSGYPPLLRLGVNDYYPHAGSYVSLMKENGLDTDSIIESIKKKYEEVV